MQMARMRRVERAAEKPDPAMPAGGALTPPTPQAGSPLSRSAGYGTERREAGEGQGRTCPLPRTRYL